MKSIQDIPAVYNLSQYIIGGFSARWIYVTEYVRPKISDRILDIGCGTANILRFLPPVEYVGFDMSQRYINSARKSYGSRGTFVHRKVEKDAIDKNASFDIVLACGVLHHLNNEETLELFKLARSAMKSKARLITLDGCYKKGQSTMARYLLSKDRGRHVRTQEGYLKLASEVFKDIKTCIRHDLLKIPYTHIIMECAK